MIVTICGAYVNCGDHLIGARARALLSEHMDQDIVVIDRKSIKPGDYDIFNKARAVLLTGGPAYQRIIYPTIYPMDLDRIETRVIPYGLGWKAGMNQGPEEFEFDPQGLEFVKSVHKTCEVSSARDPLTVSMLRANGIENVLMTGCPAWYDLAHVEQGYRFAGEPGTVVLSMPPKIQPGVFDLMKWLTERFPKARRIASFHHGFLPSSDRTGFKRARNFLKFSAAAISRGWKVSSLASNLDKMEALYASADLHVGYRVHAHLLCLSQRTASILINEDTRGEGQAMALNAPSVNMDRSGDIGHIKAAVEDHFSTKGETVSRSVETMRQTYPVMKQFLATL